MQPDQKEANDLKKQYEAPEIEIFWTLNPDMLVDSKDDDENGWGAIHFF